MTEQIILGKTGENISRVGLGGCPLGGNGWGETSENDLKGAVRAALDAGINFFDTADVYGFGRSEILLSQSLGSDIKNVVIATKFGVRWEANGRIWKDISPTYVRTAIEASLRRLKLDCIPLYYIHWPDGVTSLLDTLVELDRCRAAGKVRWFGLSNFALSDIAVAHSLVPIQALQFKMNALDHSASSALCEFALRNNISIVTWGSLAQGLLTGKFERGSTFQNGDRRSRYENFQPGNLTKNLQVVESIRKIGQSCEKTAAQVSIRWLLDTPGVSSVLFGAKKASQVTENIGSLGWTLPKEHYRLIQTMT